MQEQLLKSKCFVIAFIFIVLYVCLKKFRKLENNVEILQRNLF